MHLSNFHHMTAYAIYVYVDGEQAKRISSRTCITYEGINYNMDVKFKNGLCNCYPSKIDGYGEY